MSHTFPVGSSRELSWYPKFWEQNVHNTITFAEWSLRILWTNNGIKNIYPKGSFKTKKYILSTFLAGLFFLLTLFELNDFSLFYNRDKSNVSPLKTYKVFHYLKSNIDANSINHGLLTTKLSLKEHEVSLMNLVNIYIYIITTCIFKK